MLEIITGEVVMWLKTLVAILTAVFLATLSQAVAQEEEQETGEFAGHFHDPTNIWAVARGGQLYDNWMSVMEREPPEGNHPAYPAEAKKSGASTWRCKECHGWDYMGAAGAYSSGSHQTAIKGVRSVAGTDPEAIHQIIMDDTHAFTAEIMPHSAMEKLALFLSKGQVDMDRYIDRESKMARGNPRRGAAMFQTICAVCHGFDGKEINFKDEAKPEYIGTVCSKNPWEALHKIRFGQPGVGMVAMIAIDIEEQVDLLSYCQTLPAE
jgi:thiosulfate dehydrogenase